MKNPFMLRKNHEKKISELHKYRASEVNRLNREHDKEKDLLKKDLDEIVKELVKVSIVYDSQAPLRMWRVVTELDTDMMCRALERGNDNGFLEYIGKYVGKLVERALRSCNIQRPETLRMGRG